MAVHRYGRHSCDSVWARGQHAASAPQIMRGVQLLTRLFKRGTAALASGTATVNGMGYLFVERCNSAAVAACWC